MSLPLRFQASRGVSPLGKCLYFVKLLKFPKPLSLSSWSLVQAEWAAPACLCLVSAPSALVRAHSVCPPVMCLRFPSLLGRDRYLFLRRKFCVAWAGLLEFSI